MVAAIGVDHAGGRPERHARTTHLVPSGARTGHFATSELGGADELTDADALELLAGELYRAPIAIDLRLAPRPLKACLSLTVRTSATT